LHWQQNSADLSWRTECPASPLSQVANLEVDTTRSKNAKDSF
jgi:hypothetical protein